MGTVNLSVRVTKISLKMAFTRFEAIPLMRPKNRIKLSMLTIVLPYTLAQVIECTSRKLQDMYLLFREERYQSIDDNTIVRQESKAKPCNSHRARDATLFAHGK